MHRGLFVLGTVTRLAWDAAGRLVPLQITHGNAGALDLQGLIIRLA